MGLFGNKERKRWAVPLALSQTQTHLGLPGLDPRSRELYETQLPRGVRHRGIHVESESW